MVEPNENPEPSSAIVSRRGALQWLSAMALAVVEPPLRTIAHLCRMTVDADEGPFYPVVAIPVRSDLATAADGRSRATGDVMYLLGHVVDEKCEAVAGAEVEIWQCDAGAQYDHPRAPRNKSLDPAFQYFGKLRTGADGSYAFRTVRPSAYSVFGLRRAPHIHVRVKHAGFSQLTTEVYFAGQADDALRAGDRVFQSRGVARGEMVVDLQPAAESSARLGRAPEAGSLACEYQLQLKRA